MVVLNSGKKGAERYDKIEEKKPKEGRKMKIILGKKQQAEEVAEAKESAKAETKAEAGQAEERTSRREELPPEGLYEEEAKTDEYARVIYMNDRTVRQTISSVPVRYYDEEEKRYKRVETALKRNSRGVLENKKNTFATEFAGETKEGIYRLSRHGCEVELLAQGVAEKSIGTEEGTNTVKISEVKPHVDTGKQITAANFFASMAKGMFVGASLYGIGALMGFNGWGLKPKLSLIDKGFYYGIQFLYKNALKLMNPVGYEGF